MSLHPESVGFILDSVWPCVTPRKRPLRGASGRHAGHRTNRLGPLPSCIWSYLAKLAVIDLEHRRTGLEEAGISVRAERWRQAGGVAEVGAADSTDHLAVHLHTDDPLALNELVETGGPRLFRYLARLTADEETARDITQESLLRAIRSLQAGTYPEHLLPWLFHIATNLARDDYRSAYRQRVLLYDDLEPIAGAASNDTERIVLAGLGAAERSAAVSQAMRRLPIELRQVIHLRFVEDLPVKEIATIVGIPEGTAKSRLFRAYRLLERALAAWKPGDEGGGVRG